MKEIALGQLEGACSEQVELFEEIFGNKVSFMSLKEAKNIAKKYAFSFDFDWAAQNLLNDEGWKAYQEAEAFLWKFHQESATPHIETHAEAKSLKVYQEAIGLIWKEYAKAKAELFAELYYNQDGPERCAECDCEHGGDNCNWFKTAKPQKGEDQ